MDNTYSRRVAFLEMGVGAWMSIARDNPDQRRWHPCKASCSEKLISFTYGEALVLTRGLSWVMEGAPPPRRFVEVALKEG